MMLLDFSGRMEILLPMITTVTGKNQITIPAAIANRIGLKSGSRIDWQIGSKPDEFLCTVLPDPSVIAAILRGAGKQFVKPGQDPSAALLAERAADESSRATSLE